MPNSPPPLPDSRRADRSPPRRRGMGSPRHIAQDYQYSRLRDGLNKAAASEPGELDLNWESTSPDRVELSHQSARHGAYESPMIRSRRNSPEALSYSELRYPSSSRRTTGFSAAEDGQSYTRSRRKRRSIDDATTIPIRQDPERLVKFAPVRSSTLDSAPGQSVYDLLYGGKSGADDDRRSGETTEDDEEGFDAHLGGKVFQFVPSRASKTNAKISASFLAEDSSINTDDDSTAALQVYQSKYTGDALSDGTHTAKLTVIHSPKKQQKPLFRWMHLEQSVINFDEFSTEVSRVPAITDTERIGFTKLLTEVKRNHVRVRQTSKDSTVRHMDPRPLRVALAPEGRAKDQTFSRSLTWLCIPYFSLEKYSGLLSTSNPSSFPVETLLQSDYARTTREREMQQAVCQNGGAPGGQCFHIAQLWCIVLDNTLLITCGQMPAAVLRGDFVQMVTEPVKQPDLKMKMIYVSYYDSVLWAFPLEECMTWFNFSIHFREFWPQAVKVYHHGQSITGDDWPRVVNLAKYSNTGITLDLRFGEHPLPPTTGVLNPLPNDSVDTLNTVNEPEQSIPVSKKKFLDISKDRFHVFTWSSMEDGEDGSGRIDIKALTDYLTEVDDYLGSSTSASDRTAYQECHFSSRQLVHSYLEANKPEAKEDSSADPRLKKYEDAVDIFNAADVFFELFLPHGIESTMPTVGKFWGAVSRLVGAAISDENGADRRRRPRRSLRSGIVHSDIHRIKTTMREATRTIQSFQSLVSQAPPDVRSKIEVPDDLIRAWLHLITALIQASLNREVWIDNMNISEALIRRGMNDIINDLPTSSLLDYSVVQPMELLALLSLKLLHDSTGKFPNINETYSEYLKGLEHDITTKDSNRSYQLRLALFKQEVAVIRRIITLQMKAVVAMNGPPKLSLADQTRKEKEMLEKERDKSKADRFTRTYYPERQQQAVYATRHAYYHAPTATDIFTRGLNDFDVTLDPDGFSKLSATDPGGFRELFGRECAAWLDRRDREFYELSLEASRLETMNTNNIEVTKDRQEAAVYAFTMVTIIFLPLSTISSIFGMNSSDVRDMDAGQWVYWATAVPTTLLVIVAGLWWMGELRNLIDWARGVPSSSPSRWSRRVYREGRLPAGGGYASRPLTGTAVTAPLPMHAQWQFDDEGSYYEEGARRPGPAPRPSYPTRRERRSYN
ncbi:hypothetical protein F4775DRAFT_521473 [Biscogniauxia sp. FL1348]|nr:hypothetical protein F4775DRAFT_521473 [Biscogniauxia sp. FL1348]